MENYHLYEGQKIGSFIITKYNRQVINDQAIYSIKAKCLYCKDQIEMNNINDINNIIQTLISQSCAGYLPQDGDLIGTEHMSQINRAKNKLTYFIDIDAEINSRLLKQQEKEIEQLIKEYEQNKEEDKNDPPQEEKPSTPDDPNLDPDAPDSDPDTPNSDILEEENT